MANEAGAWIGNATDGLHDVLARSLGARASFSALSTFDLAADFY